MRGFDRSGKIFMIFIFFMLTPLVIIAIVFAPLEQFGDRPEQSAQVEVVDKRIRTVRHGGGKFGGSRTSYTYIVAFKFPDGSIKELKVGRDDDRGFYDYLQEGDTGTLTYKEIANIEERRKNEDARYASRLFIGFKKGPAPELNE